MEALPNRLCHRLAVFGSFSILAFMNHKILGDLFLPFSRFPAACEEDSLFLAPLTHNLFIETHECRAKHRKMIFKCCL